MSETTIPGNWQWNGVRQRTEWPPIVKVKLPADLCRRRTDNDPTPTVEVEIDPDLPCS